MLNSKLTKRLTLTIVVAGCLAIILHHQTLKGEAENKADNRYEKLQIFTKVLNMVQQYYVEKVDVQKLIYGGIKGMLSELDPHTNFLPPDLFKEFESETSGEFGGIGIEIGMTNEILTIISPIEDTPAWKAGIKAGDKVVEINGESTKGLSLVEAAQKMRGKLGSPVKLGIMRDGFDKPKEFVVTRATVKVRSVKYTDLNDGYAYVKITSFIEKTHDELKKALEDHIKKQKSLKGLIIDVRSNPGGLLDQAVKISDTFLDTGVIVSTMGKNQKDKEVVYAKKDGSMVDFPIIILINEYSASASEILAGALKDNKRAVVMGQRSFGKGSVQSVVKLGDGSGLKLTVARYYTPSGKSIQAEGITPDVFLENISTESLEKIVVRRKVRREADIRGHLLGDSEKAAAAPVVSPGASSTTETDFEDQFLWDDLSKVEDESKLPPKDQFLRKDYQVLRAYNYLKAWKMFRDYKY